MIDNDEGLLEEMFTLIEECTGEEDNARTNLQALIDSSGESLESHLQNIEKIHHQTTVAEQRAHILANNIHELHENADAVSSKVRQTHLVMERVKEVIEAIEGNIGMKSCVQGVEEAINDEDYEKAATLVSRVYVLNQKQKQREEAETDSKSLDEADKKIRHIVKTKFKQSIVDGNFSDMERFGKLFSPLRMENEGLEVYCRYLVQNAKAEIKQTVDEGLLKIADLKIFSEEDSDNEEAYNQSITYVDLLRGVFDICAALIEENEEFIAISFGGPDKVIYFMQMLLHTLEEFVIKVLDSFSTRREVKERATQLIEKFRVPRQSLNKNIPSVNRQIEQDPKELDLVLEEMAHLCQTSLTLERFLHEKEKQFLVGIDNPKYTLPRITNLTVKMQQVMGAYIPLDEYFMKQSIGKAIQVNRKDLNNLQDERSDESYGRDIGYATDSSEESSESSDSEIDEEADDANKCSPMIDDVFYILQKSLNRADSTHDVSIICATMNNMTTLLTSGQLDDELNKDTMKITGKRGEQYSLGDIKRIIHALNDLEMTSSYVIKLKQELDKMIEKYDKTEQKQIKSCCDDLIKVSYDLSNSVERSIKRLVLSGLDHIVNDSLQQLRDEVTYNLTDQQYNDNAMRDPFVEGYVQYFGRHIAIYQKNLTKSNFDKLVQEILVILCEKLEQVIYRKRFNQLGSWQFDKDLRAIMNYFSGMTQSTIRDKFARLTQIAFLLKMTCCEEVLDYWGDENGMMNWRLTQTDIKKILILRIEFDYQAVNALQLT